MKIFYDTEFLDDGRTIDLISIGMVAEDGRELYAISRQADYSEIVHHEWLRQNVLASLPIKWPLGREDNPGAWLWDVEHPDYDRLALRKDIADKVRDFVLATPEPELWAYYSAYDHVALAQLWGPMMNLPAGVPMQSDDLVTHAKLLGLTPQDLPRQADGHHNALADARHNAVMAAHLADVAAKRA